MKKMLVAGGGYADIPLIQAAQQLGYHVITSGNRAGDLGHQYADEVQLADFSDYETMLALAQQMGIDAICPCCNDFSALSCAYVAERLGLPGYDPLEVSLTLHHKDQYRQFAAKAGIPGPQATSFSSVEAALAEIETFRLPIIVKPVDLTGGKGINVAHNLVQAKTSIKNAFAFSKVKRIVVEQYFSGSRHGYSAMLRDKQVIFEFFDDEYYYLNQYLVSAASFPGDIPDNVRNELRNNVESIAGILNLCDGIFHVQYIMNAGRPFIIEICRRPPGDLYIKFVQHATGVNYPLWIVRSFAGLDCSAFGPYKMQGFFTRHCIMGNSAGVLESIDYDLSIADNIFDQFVWWRSGQIITDYLTEKFGIVFLRFASAQEMCEKTSNMHRLIRVNIRPHIPGES